MKWNGAFRRPEWKIISAPQFQPKWGDIKKNNILLSQIAFAKPQRQRQAALADTALVRPMCNSATLTKGDSATPSHHPFPTSDSRTVTGATRPYAVYFPHKYIFSLLRKKICWAHKPFYSNSFMHVHTYLDGCCGDITYSWTYSS